MAVQDIHVKEHLGIVTSDTSTIKFSFFLTPLSDKVSVRKNDYVIVDHPVLGEVCPILAVVKEISNFEKATGSFAEKAVEMVAACEVIGYVDLRKGEARVLRELLFPPDTGTKVYLPFSEFLNDVFLRDRDGNVCSSALHLGSRQSLVNTRGERLGSLVSF